MKTKIPPCDPEKQARDPGNQSHVPSRDPPAPVRSPDITRDQIRSHALTQPRDQARYGRATNPLIGIWKTVGKIHRSGIPQGIPHSLSPMDTGTGDMPSPV